MADIQFDASPERAAQLSPVLEPAHLERMRAHGRALHAESGQTLVEPGSHHPSIYVVEQGELEIVRRAVTGDTIVLNLGPGQFTGEANMLSGRPGLVHVRATKASDLIELDREQLLALVQTDSELSEILMRAFILRRLSLVAHGFGDAVLLGSSHCSSTLRIKEFLNRNSHPFTYLDLDQTAEVQELLDRFHIGMNDVPVLLCHGNRVLRNPSNQEIAACLGFNEAIDPTVTRDLLVVGAGPAGLAAAVFGASEGLDVLVLESKAPGGQAGSSSRIENYLGFPMGISGQDLAGRAYAQAQKFGAEVMIAEKALKLVHARKPYTVELDNGQRVMARTIVIATGAEYRRLDIPNLAAFEGAGVYYGATFMEAQLCRDEDVIVVGGGNAAGQAAVFLSQTSKRVLMLVRGPSLAETMSRYLIRRIEGNPEIELHTNAEIVGLDGNDSLEQVTWRDRSSGETRTEDIRHVFSMAGAVPNTKWVEGCLALDNKGFIKTGNDLSSDDLAAKKWPMARRPYLLETSLPGVFAVGDVRGNNFKRVAPAVGEGSVAVGLVHAVLHE